MKKRFNVKGIFTPDDLEFSEQECEHRCLFVSWSPISLLILEVMAVWTIIEEYVPTGVTKAAMMFRQTKSGLIAQLTSY